MSANQMLRGKLGSLLLIYFSKNQPKQSSVEVTMERNKWKSPHKNLEGRSLDEHLNPKVLLTNRLILLDMNQHAPFFK